MLYRGTVLRHLWPFEYCYGSFVAVHQLHNVAFEFYSLFEFELEEKKVFHLQLPRHSLLGQQE